MALLTLAQQQQFKPISPNWAAAKKVLTGVTNFEQLQIEVEEKELKTLLGVAFLQDLQANALIDPIAEKYSNLLDGTSFEDCNGNTIAFKGIRYQLAFMNYSKYISESHFADTFTGMVQKNRAEATPLSVGDIKRSQSDAREIAMQEYEIMKQFIEKNTDIYTLWSFGYKKKPWNPQIIGIKKTLL